MRPIVFLFLSLCLYTFNAFANGPRKPANSLTLADLKAPPIEKQISDREEIERKMYQPAKVPDSNQRTRVRIEATCTDARNVTRNSQDPLYKDCLEERPRVAKPPIEGSSPGATTFGVRFSR